MNKIFITGGAGFIGTNFIYHCLNKNDVVLNYDLLTYAGNLNNSANNFDIIAVIITAIQSNNDNFFIYFYLKLFLEFGCSS